VDFPSQTAGLPNASASELQRIEDGGSVGLRIAPVAKQIGEATVRMLAYNGSIPGTTLVVREGSTITVDLINDGDLDTTVHWHGLRLENRYDGTHETQQAIPVGGRFSYQLTFPDPGIYWYHPHIREDYGQELGLYGNILVEPAEPAYWPRVHREVLVTLDDVLIEDGQIAPFGRAETTYVAMGRFGNVMLVAGEPALALDARPGEIVRFYLTNTANTRVFDIRLPQARMKLVGGDSGRSEREELVDHVVVAPSERVVVDVLLADVGHAAIEHRTPQQTYVLGTITVAGEPASPLLADGFSRLRVNPEWAHERERLASALAAPPAKTLAFVAELDVAVPDGPVHYVCPMHPDVVSAGPGHCPQCGMKLIAAGVEPAPEGGAPHHDHAAISVHEHGAPAGNELDAEAVGIEWEDDMVEFNRTTTPSNMHWQLVDRDTGAVNHEIDWRFRVGDQVKVRLVNELDSDHPMHHPFHVHGAGRFVVAARDGVPEENLVWKDTVLVRTGATVDILLDVTNPGIWMAHCHISEHHEGGMMFSFTVDGPGSPG
jgi:FtsP/CotA-like multicopper oxidase with cupredoxin domain